MTDDVLQKEFEDALAEITSLDALESLRLRYLGKQGVITEKLKSLGKMDPDARKTAGAALNVLRDKVSQHLALRKEAFEDLLLNERLSMERLDMSLPPQTGEKGTHHLITQTMNEIIDYFEGFGFFVAEGSDIETEEFNFDALNIPAHHPARQSHDTFYIKDMERMLLRTHTSAVQIHTLKKEKPPLRFISPGRVYRVDDCDATHLPMFHQLEGVVVEKGIHLGHLKSCLIEFCRTFFQTKDLKARFRPSFFPFTEPSFEMDIGWGDHWLEVLGCGMIHPNVLRYCGLSPEDHQGFAFGLGVTRFTMIKYKVRDIRDFVGGDLRWHRAAGVPMALAR